MNKNLLIVGAGTYGVLTSEIAKDMECFEKLDFVDDTGQSHIKNVNVVGTTKDLTELENEYSNIVVAIGNSKVRLALLEKIACETTFKIVSVISPKAWISPSARIMEGCIIEPMAVVHTGCEIESGCIISAGAVINHASRCCKGVHVDCNATVEGYCYVPPETKVCCGEVFKQEKN